jgi:ABC-type multidrug transport system ATPase subunit
MSTQLDEHHSVAEPNGRDALDPNPVSVLVDGLEVRVGRHALVSGVTLAVDGGEVLAIAGASGAGKSSLLEAMAGIRAPSGGSVRFTRAHPDEADERVGMGFVPQADILHLDLPLRSSLRYAALLRLPTARSRAAVDEVVDDVLARLELTSSADVRVGSLSGGQRKRASIASELLTRPDVLFLDEPTSGLDPATAGEVMRTLRGLAEQGTTVVFTTHALADLERADRLAFVAAGGRLAFAGTVTEARQALGSRDLADLYRRFARVRPAATDSPEPQATRRRRRARTSVPVTGATRQWWVLTRRTVALLASNRLTLAIMFGSPLLVTTMMVVLFPAGAAADPARQPNTAIQSAFWIAFAGFFFGLTAGLLQIVPEAAIVRRERIAGVRPGVYVASKLAALAPVLLLVNVVMLVVLRIMDRLPAAAGSSAPTLALTLVLESLSALALGLLASALVRDASQATLALPMLCFPQVLFAGAIVAVPDMALAGSATSHAMATRWGFEAIGRSFGFGAVVPFEGELAGFAPAFSGAVASSWAVLAVVTVSCLVATAAVIERRTST